MATKIRFLFFQSPSIVFPFVDSFICYSGNGMIESMLEPYLKNKAEATQVFFSIFF